MAVEENIVVKVAIDTAESQNTLQGLENSIDELKKLRDGEQIGSKAFNDLSASIQKTEARIKDVELQFESLDFEQKLTAGTDAINTLAGGFMVAEGAANLMGIQSESLERSLQKMAAAMSLTMGLRDMANGIIALRKLGGAAGLAKKGIDALNAAMKANPWGALLAAVVAVAAAVAVFVINSRNAAKALDVQLQKSLLLNEARVQAAKAIAQEKQNLDSLVKAAKDETLSKEARQEAIKQINEISPEYLGNITLETINSEDATIAINKYANAIERKARAQAFAGKMAEIEAQILEKELMSNDELAKSRTGLMDVTKNSITFIKSKLSADEESLTMKETLIKLGKEDVENEIAGLQVRKQALKELMDSEQEALLQDEAFVRVRGKQIEATKKLQKSLADAMKNALSESLKAQEAELSAFYQAVEQVETEHFDKFITDQQKEINAVTDKFFELITLAEQYGEDTKLLEDAREKALADIRKKYRDEEAQILEQLKMESFAEEEELAELIRQANQTQLQNEMDDVNAHYFDLIERAKQYGLDTTALEKERTDKLAELQIESEQKVFDAKMQLAQASVGILQGLQGLVKQGSDAQKALALTEIAANTAIGFIQGLNVAQQAALGTGPAAAYAFPIFYASQVAAVLAAAGKAKSILGKGGGGGSAPSIPSAGATASIGGTGATIGNISNTAALVDQQQQEITTQVVVLESDITTTQENVTTVSELSSF